MLRIGHMAAGNQWCAGGTADGGSPQTKTAVDVGSAASLVVPVVVVVRLGGDSLRLQLLLLGRPGKSSQNPDSVSLVTFTFNFAYSVSVSSSLKLCFLALELVLMLLSPPPIVFAIQLQLHTQLGQDPTGLRCFRNSA